MWCSVIRSRSDDGPRGTASRGTVDFRYGESYPQFTPYIQEAIDYAEKSGTELIMALDVTDALDPAVVKARVDESPVVAEKKLDAAEVTAVLLSLKGVMLGVTLGEKPYGSVKVDFGRDPKALEGSAGQMLLNALAKHGAMIDDFQSWKEAVKGNTITFSGYLTTTGLRQIISLMDTPVTSAVATDEPAPLPELPALDQDPAAVAAQKYFSSVNQFFDGLARQGAAADRAVRRVVREVRAEDRPVADGQRRQRDVGLRRLRVATAAQCRGSDPGHRDPLPRAPGGRRANAGGVTPGYYGRELQRRLQLWWELLLWRQRVRAGKLRPGRTCGSSSMARTQVKVQEKAAGTSAARAIIKDISNATAVVRRQMTEKYKVEF